MQAELHDVGPGKIAAVVTYLQMTTPPSAPCRMLPPRMSFDPIGGDIVRYKRLFKTVGAPWLWFSRLTLSDDALIAVLNASKVEAYALVQDAQDIGLVEVDARLAPKSVELAFLGLDRHYIGRGLGGAMLDFALMRAWAYAPQKVEVHSCTLDHPKALDFYRTAGFIDVKRAVEISDDPRGIGLLPRDCAPHSPMLS